MNGFCFNEKKATQLAAAFIAHSGGVLNHMKLIKLMYLADRTALLRWERPITGDAYFALKHGPILSATYSMISDGQTPNADSYWFHYISESVGYEVSLLQPCPADDLSEAEEAVIKEVFAQYGDFEKWALVRHLHHVLPEWQDPGESAFPIPFESILKGEGWSPQEISRLQADVADLNAVQALLGCQ
jgi:uncharacterized phage-associated protein